MTTWDVLIPINLPIPSSSSKLSFVSYVVTECIASFRIGYAYVETCLLERFLRVTVCFSSLWKFVLAQILCAQKQGFQKLNLRDSCYQSRCCHALPRLHAKHYIDQ